jgi:hypothetical protein
LDEQGEEVARGATYEAAYADYEGEGHGGKVENFYISKGVITMFSKTFRYFIVLFSCFIANAWATDIPFHGLPVIQINTENGAPILDKVNYVPMQFVLTDKNNPDNSISLTAEDFSDGGIRGRGNTSWTETYKKSYRIKFNKKQSLFGLEKAKSWILLANYFDITLIKNSLAFELGHRLNVPYTPSYHYVELYLNGEYRGNYMLTEQKDVAPGRVDIDPTKGWFVEIDRLYDEEPKFRTTKYNMPIIIKSPDFGTNSANPMYYFVKNDLNKLCDSMASVNFPENGYRDLIDMKSIINYFLVNVILYNGDFSLPGSVYFHKNNGGKISGGILWDFDTAFGFSWDSYILYVINDNIRGNLYPGYSFFARFFQDPVFLVKWKENWNNNFSVISSMTQFIDNMAGEIRISALENYEKWHYIGHYPVVDFDYWVNKMKQYYDNRINYLNIEYNKIEVLPTSKTFTKQKLGYSDIVPQTFTFVAYGDITELSATLIKADSSDFEISTELSKQATGNGGYLATVSVKPKNLLFIGTHKDHLILSAKNQGNEFYLWVPLSFSVEHNDTTASITRLPQIASGNHITQARNGINLSSENNAVVEVYGLKGNLIQRQNLASGVYSVSLGHLPKGMYIVKVKFGNRENRSSGNILRVTVM